MKNMNSSGQITEIKMMAGTKMTKRKIIKINLKFRSKIIFMKEMPL
jgi:hypothetical protein